MAERLVKCQKCEMKDVKWSERFDKMEIESKTNKETGKTSNLYYHKGKCWKDRLNQIQDMKNKDELDAVLKKMFNLKVKYPDNIWWMIEDLRNGTNRFKKFWKRSFRKGYPYLVIAEAFRMSKDNIEWARMNKRFKTLEEEMRYSLKIIQSKLEDAYKKINRTQQQEEFSKAKEEIQMPDMIEEIFDTRGNNFVKKKDELDFSDLLGDD